MNTFTFNFIHKVSHPQSIMIRKTANLVEQTINRIVIGTELESSIMHKHRCELYMMELDEDIYAYTSILNSRTFFPTKSKIILNSKKEVLEELMSSTFKMLSSSLNDNNDPYLYYILLHECIHALGIMDSNLTKWRNYITLVNSNTKGQKETQIYNGCSLNAYTGKHRILIENDMNHLKKSACTASHFFSCNPTRTLSYSPFFLLYDYGYKIDPLELIKLCS